MPADRKQSNGNGNRAKELVRCAIYTRKSTEEGLEQEFNSLDAQREASEAFINSQKQEGWVALPRRYDDGGFTGANMERPALKRLLADIESGRRDSARELRLAVEVVSPSSARYDRVDKRSRYQEERVEELWLVDPESELVERWRPDDERPEILAKTLIWQPVGSDASLSIDLVALFEESKR